jgi:DNA repair protein RadA/Sms
VAEPAADLGFAVAGASSYLDRAIAADLVVMGEVGLAGEVRAVTGLDARLRDAAALGFAAAVVPRSNVAKADPTAGLEVHGVASVEAAVQLLLGG